MRTNVWSRVTGVVAAAFVLWAIAGAAATLAGRTTSDAQAAAPAAQRASTPSVSAYVGSAACSRCHAPIYERWKRSRMANVVRDPREHPDAIIPDLNQPNPVVTFTKDQIAFV